MTACGRALRRIAAALATVAFASSAAAAHESRPGYLDLRETAPGRYEVLWKQPARGPMRLRIDPRFPEEARIVGAAEIEPVDGALVTRFVVQCEGGLAGRELAIAGLEATLTDVLVRVRHLRGAEENHLLRPEAPFVTIGGGRGGLARAAAFARLGVEHILRGADHLLFVLGLLLLVRDRWMLVKTVTSFTLAHSVTLAAATLGWARAPAEPLHAAIALSILFLGPEIVRARGGGTSLAIRHPWFAAFAFGLLHGFGFAGGLAEMGLSRAEIPLALLLFNVGVELGQVAFVGLALLLAWSWRVLEVRWPRPAAALPAYAVGALGAFWTIDRTFALFGGVA